VKEMRQQQPCRSGSHDAHLCFHCPSLFVNLGPRINKVNSSSARRKHIIFCRSQKVSLQVRGMSPYNLVQHQRTLIAFIFVCLN
jgi:hypothetical protein